MIPLAVPNLTGKEGEYVARAIAANHVGPGGPFVDQFEDMVAEAAGRKWAVATVTGTAALEAAAFVLFGGRTDLLHVHANAFPAMGNALKRLGRRVVHENRDEGHDCSFVHGDIRWPMIADTAPAIGNPPTHAIVDCYSFAANKTVTTGQGGTVCGDDRSIETAIRELIVQGFDRTGLYNFRLADINAAMGCAQMERLDEFRAKKAAIWNRYKEAGLEMVERGPSRWMSTIRETEFTDFRAKTERLKTDFIGYRVDRLADISLPCSTGLTKSDQDRVIAALTHQ